MARDDLNKCSKTHGNPATPADSPFSHETVGTSGTFRTSGTFGTGPQIVVVGSINADLTVRVDRHPLPGETLLGSGGELTPGGKGANQAVAAARLGASVAMVGALGSDVQAEAATRLLIDAGVDLTAVTRIDGPTGLAVITVAEDGENTILVVPGANSHVSPADVDRNAELIAGAAVVLLQGELPGEVVEAVVKRVRSANARLVINLAPVIAVDPDALLAADPLVVNEHEAAGVLEQLAPGAQAATPEEQARALIDAGFPSAIITLGAKGALVAEADAPAPVIVSSPTVTPVDTVGAGDAFTGALCRRLVEGDSLADAASHACRVGAFAVTRPGAQPSYPHEGDALPT